MIYGRDIFLFSWSHLCGVALNLNWGLEDPTGQSDDKFLEVMALIEENILELRKTVLEMQKQ